ncbi:RNA polymerase sigma factor [Cyclobacterium sediminis]
MRKPNQHKEAELVFLLKQGDKSAFEELYHRHIDRMLTFASSFLFNPLEAEEVVQIVFISVWENRRNLDPSKPFSAYLYRSIKNRMLNRIRDRKKMCDLSDISEEKSLDGLDIEREICLKETTREALEIVSKMPKIQQKVFILSKIDGFSNSEIAEKLTISTRTVEHHIYKAKKFFKVNNIENYGFIILIVNEILFWL